MNRKNIALILSGGEGKRFDKSKPKQFFKINDQTILEITVEKFIKKEWGESDWEVGFIQCMIGPMV